MKIKKKKVVKKAAKPVVDGINTNVRFTYSREFARALGKNGTGKGRARRKDVKVWAQKALNRMANDLVGAPTEDDAEAE